MNTRHINRTRMAHAVRSLATLGLSLAAVLAASSPATASSHREVPFSAGQAKVDATDLCMFRS